MADEPNPDDAAIAEFHRAARKRKALIFAVAGIVALLGGVGAIVLSIIAGGQVPDGAIEGSSSRYEARTIVLGIVLVVAGGWMCFTGYRIGSGQIDDIS
jgi:hypothetical protein